MMKTNTHIGVYAVIRKNENLLLVKKSRGPYTNLFDLPGGRIETNETGEQALVREIQEETGIIATKWTFLTKLYHNDIYVIGGEKIHFHHHGSIYLIDEFDEYDLNFQISLEDVNGCIWNPRNNLELLTPFAKTILSA